MDFASYKSHLKQMAFGKHLPDAKYIHVELLPKVPHHILELMVRIQNDLSIGDFEYNVVKFHAKDFKISLLNYPTFFEEPYPALTRSCTVDLVRKKYRVIDFSHSTNPPILHRKETFLPPDHPLVPEFSLITKEGEAAGLYENTRRIGFKQHWERLIKRKGYQLIGNRLVKTAAIEVGIPESLEVQPKEVESITVVRHKTAIDRHKLSAPVASLARHGFLDKRHSLFDYGCGKGDDLRELQAHGIEATGWDPAYFPSADKEKRDIVNLGFVINVIENPAERRECLREAYRLSEKLLVVSAMLGGPKIVEQFTPHGDGVITSRDTFQKYYTQSELRQYIEQTLDTSPVAVGPGIFFVFKDSVTEEEFYEKREHRQIEWTKLSEKIQKTKPKKPKESTSDYEQNKIIIDEYFQFCLDLGREPVASEFDFSDQIRRIFGSVKKGYRFLIAHNGTEIFEKAKQSRIEDLHVYLALSFFGKRKPLTKMPASLKRDINTFFGSYPNAIEQAKELLFSVGSPEIILKACEYANKEMGIGYLDGTHSLQFHVSLLQQLPAVLRVYVGCATQLYGDLEDIDLIKVHTQSGKVTLLKYDDFVNSPLPELVLRIKIKLKEQQVDFFDQGHNSSTTLLFNKSYYVPVEFPFFEEQVCFEKKLQSFRIFDFSGFGPSKEEFFDVLINNGYSIFGFDIGKC
jgi:DNA phosphorothioation-associated putative methyltransferase